MVQKHRIRNNFTVKSHSFEESLVNSKQLSHVGVAVIALAALVAALTQANPWSSADVLPNRLWQEATHTLQFSKLTLHFQPDKSAPFGPGNNPDSRIRWPD
jgi:hypothetical protein